MYDLNSAINKANEKQKSSGGGFGVFVKDTNVTYIALKKGIDNFAFGILAGHNPETITTDADGKVTCSDLSSWVPHRDPHSGNFFPFGRMIEVYRNVGHGPFSDKKRYTMVSKTSFAPAEAEVFCPIAMVHDYAARSREWSYLTEKRDVPYSQWGDTIFSKPETWFLFNAIIVNAAGQTVNTLGVLDKSSVQALWDCIDQRNLTVTQEMLQVNPFAGYVLGDITDPNRTVLLNLHRQANNKNYRQISPLLTQQMGQQHQALTYVPTGQFLQNRYIIEDGNSYLNRPTDQQLVDTLCRALNGRNANGIHEHQLIKEALASTGLTVPEPPAPDTTSSFGAAPGGQAGGFPGAAPAAGGFPGAQAPAAGGFPGAQAAPSGQAGGFPGSGAGPVSQPGGFQAPGGNPAPGGFPGAQAGAPQQQLSQPTFQQPPAEQAQQEIPLPAQQPNTAPAAGNATAAATPTMDKAVEGAAAQQETPQAEGVPGGAVPTFDRNDMLGRLNAQK